MPDPAAGAGAQTGGPASGKRLTLGKQSRLQSQARNRPLPTPKSPFSGEFTSAGADQPPPNLGQRAARGAATTLAAQGLRIIVQSASLVLLSRLLSPEDFGLVASVTAFTGFADILRDFGLSSAAVQAKRLTGAQRSNLFWLNSATGVLAAGLVLACAVPIADLYHEPRTIDITRALALVFVVDGLANQFRAEVNRRLQFGRLAIADVGSQTAAGIVAITLAAIDPGTAALIAMPITQAVVELVILLFAARWRPGWPQRGAQMRPLLSFGISLFFVQLLTYGSRNADNVTVGKRFGASALGIYSRAFQLLELPLNQLSGPITSVALPVLSRLQDDYTRLLAFVRRGQNLLMQITLLALTVAAAQAPVLVPGVLGEQWRASVPIFQILAVGGVFQTSGYATYWLYLATGNSAANLHYSLIIRPLTVLCIVVGSVWGVTGVAWGFTVSLVAAWPFGLWSVGRATGISTGSLFWPCVRTMVCYGAAGLASSVASAVVVENPLLRLVLGLGVLLGVLGALFVLIPSFRASVRDVFSAVQLLRSGGEQVSASPETNGNAPTPEAPARRADASPFHHEGDLR